MERNLRRMKNKKVPTAPKTIEDVLNVFSDPAIITQYGLNLRKSERFYINTVKNPGFTVFASFQAIKMIEKNIPLDERRYLLDATFKVKPLGDYYQVLIIHIELKNDVSPIYF